MIVTMHDIYLLSPELSLAGVALAIILLDLFVSRKILLVWLGVLGLLLPVAFSLVLWSDVNAEASGQMEGIFGTLVVDKFSLFFKFLLAVAAALVLANLILVRRAGKEIPGRILRADTSRDFGDDVAGVGDRAYLDLRGAGADGAAHGGAGRVPAQLASLPSPE